MPAASCIPATSRSRAAPAPLLRLACLLSLSYALAGCITSARSLVAVQPLDLHEGYREYSDSLLSSGQLSLVTRQALNLVPEAGAAVDTSAQLQALGASERIDPATRAFARSELALRAAQALDGHEPVLSRQYYLIAARESARLLFPDGKLIHIDPFDRKYRLASGFYSLAAGRYFLLLMSSGRYWTGDVTEATPAGTFNVTFDNDDSDLYAYFFNNYSLAWSYRITGLRNHYTRDGIGVAMVARRAPGKSFPLERYFPSGGYIAPITVYLRFDPDEPTLSPDPPSRRPERVRVGLADTRLAEYVCFGRQTLPVAADFTAPYAVQITRDHSRAAGRAALFGDNVPGTRLGITINAPWDPAKIPLILIHGLASSAEIWRELTNDLLGSQELRGRYQIIHYTYATNETVLATAARFRRELGEFLATVKYDPAVSPKLVLIGHSMGGLLAKSLAVDSGTKLWDSVFRVPAESLHADDDVRRTFEETLLLKPSPSVGLIVFMGTPQHGSDEADSFAGSTELRLIAPAGGLCEPQPGNRPAGLPGAAARRTLSIYHRPPDQRGVSLAPQSAHAGLRRVAHRRRGPLLLHHGHCHARFARPGLGWLCHRRQRTAPRQRLGYPAADSSPAIRSGSAAQRRLSNSAGARRNRAGNGLPRARLSESRAVIRRRGRPSCPRVLAAAPHGARHRIVQCLHAEGDVLHDAVDEKSRRRANVAAAPALDVFAHLLQINVIVHLGGIAGKIEIQGSRVAVQILVLEVGLILEQHVVHRPELALRRRGLRGLRRQLCMRMRFLKRKMPEYEADLVGKPLQQQFRRRRRHLAAGTFEVAVFDQCHPRMCRALEMVGGFGRDGQRDQMRLWAHGSGSWISRAGFTRRGRVIRWA